MEQLNFIGKNHIKSPFCLHIKSMNISHYNIGQAHGTIKLLSHRPLFYLSLYIDQYIIRKTCQCNIYPLKPQFYIANLGYAGVYLFFLFLLQNIDCGYSLEPPRRGGSNVYPQSMFWAKIRKISKKFCRKFSIFTT